MSRYARWIYFERLVELRRAYAALGHDDRTAALTIDEVVTWADCELSATRAWESAPATEA